MAHLVTSAIEKYNDILEKHSDPRVNNWAMMSSPVPTLLICVFYVYFSKVLGPLLMENRKPLNLRRILIVYNFIQTVFSAWIFYEYLQSGWWGHYSFRCQPVDYSNSPIALRMVRTCWWYYFSKFTEFFDTLFFILRKKNNQVTTLHVIHHGVMPFSVWLGMKFAPGGHSTFFALLNTLVHIVMYFYYMVSAMGPQYQKYLWWKKYLTTFQMVQFVAIMLHQFQLLFTECNYPKGFMIWIGLHGVMFLFLFTDFYKVKYQKKAYSKNGAPSGFCMPILENDKTHSTSNGYTNSHNKDSLIRQNGKVYSNGNLKSSYATVEYSKSVQEGYSNGINNGYITQSIERKKDK